MRQPIAATLALLLAACQSSPAPDALEAEAIATRSAALASVPNPEACGGRYVGLTLGAPCPPGNLDWGQVALYTNVNTASSLGAHLSQYCAYDWQGVGSPQPATLPPDSSMSTEWLTPDCHVVAPMQASPSQTRPIVWRSLQDAFFRAVDRVDELPIGNQEPASIAVAVADTSPSIPNPPVLSDRSSHGHVIARTIQRLACPGPLPETACAGFVINQLGLPRISPYETDPANGGFYGHLTEIATGILDAVDTWQRIGSHDRLIINLSLGWSGEYGGPYPGNNAHLLPLPARMVHAAIQYARCHGVMVIAAAGNRMFTGQDEGLLYPAGWVNKSAPSPLDCVGIVPGRPAFAPGGGPDPLVTSVAGLDAQDRPLINARLNSRTPISAAGYSATYYDAHHNEVFPVMTGSSISAAAVSATAAVVWAYRPGLTPSEVLSIVYQSAVDLSVNADACHGGPPCVTTQRRTSICQALQAACATGLERCAGATLPNCSTPLAFEDTSATLRNNQLQRLDQIQGIEIPFSSVEEWSEVEAPACNRTIQVAGQEPPAVLCPESQAQSPVATPWAAPQPIIPNCGVCLLEPTGGIFEFDVVSDPLVTLIDPYLMLKYETGWVTYSLESIDSAFKELKPGEKYELTGLTSEGISASYLIFTVTDGTDSVTTYEPVYVF